MPGAKTASKEYSRFLSFQMWSSVSSSGMLSATCAFTFRSGASSTTSKRALYALHMLCMSTIPCIVEATNTPLSISMTGHIIGLEQSGIVPRELPNWHYLGFQI